MNIKIEKWQRNFDPLRWLLVFCLLLGIIAGNHFYPDIPLMLGVIFALLLFFGAAMVALTTQKGVLLRTFMREARIELRRVVWPTRQDTLQTTALVIIATMVLALILWVVDAALVRLVSYITSLRF